MVGVVRERWGKGSGAQRGGKKEGKILKEHHIKKREREKKELDRLGQVEKGKGETTSR